MSSRRQIAYSDVAAFAPNTAPSRTVAALGDSITYHGIQENTAPHWQTSSIGYFPWIQFLTNGRVRCPIEYNFGVNGDSTSQMLARLPAIVAAKPGVCVVLAGTNNASAGTSAASTIADLITIYNTLAAAGIIVIAVPILGRTMAFTATAGKDIAQSVNSWIRSQAFVRQNFYVADCQSVFDDVTSTSFGCRSTMVDSGGLHPNVLGAYTIASQIVPILNNIFPVPFSPLWHQADAFNSDNLRGCLNTNGTMQGTGGSNGSTSGSVATSWSCSATSIGGGTVVCSKSTFADGRACQQFDLSGNYTGTTSQVNFFTNLSSNFANIAAGDILECTAEISVAAASQNLAGVSLLLQTTCGGTLQVLNDMFANSAFSGLTTAYGGILRTPRLVVPAGPPTTGTLTVRAYFVNVGAVSSPLAATVKFGSVAVRKII